MLNAAIPTEATPVAPVETRAPGIAVHGLTKSYGDHVVLRDVSLVVPSGSTLALLGPSGCGKTTLLRTIAGLERPGRGTVELDGEQVTSPGRSVPPERRRIGMVFQDWALFPHLTVGDNVGYGLARDERRSGRVAESLALVGLHGFTDRSPGTLSGGQQQRVALARALAPRPRALLLDEPFSNLDSSLRVEVRTEVHTLLADLGITAVFVTHDQEEAFVLGDQVAVMRDGEVVQRGTPPEVYAHPVSPWVAGFVGEANLVPGRGHGSWATTPLGPVPLAEPARGPVEVLLRPEHLAIGSGDGAEVVTTEFHGHDSLTVVRVEGGATLRVRQPGPPPARRHDRVRLLHAGPPAVAYPVVDGA